MLSARTCKKHDEAAARYCVGDAQPLMGDVDEMEMGSSGDEGMSLGGVDFNSQEGTSRFRSRGALAGGVMLFMVVGVALMNGHSLVQTSVTSGGRTDSAANRKYERLFDFQLCGQYDGMFAPSGDVCCAKTCGAGCGGLLCGLSPGGSAACCQNGIKPVCGEAGAKAPCRLTGKTFKAETKQCKAYGGIDHPLAHKCCDVTCGALCGAKNCQLAPAGFKGCCSTQLPEQCDATKKAPCMLPLTTPTTTPPTTTPVPSDKCSVFGGKLHPLGQKCCGPYCGALCGSKDCHSGNGGDRSCCKETAGLPTCNGKNAPCALALVQTIFSGVIQLSVDNPEGFVNSADSRVACRAALVKVLALSEDEVQVTGISSGNGGPKADPIVGYEMTVGSASTLTKEQISSKASVLTAALNTALKNEGVLVTVSAITMPDPAETKTSPAPQAPPATTAAPTAEAPKPEASTAAPAAEATEAQKPKATTEETPKPEASTAEPAAEASEAPKDAKDDKEPEASTAEPAAEASEAPKEAKDDKDAKTVDAKDDENAKTVDAKDDKDAKTVDANTVEKKDDKDAKHDEASKGDDVATEAPKKDDSKGGDDDEKGDADEKEDDKATKGDDAATEAPKKNDSKGGDGDEKVDKDEKKDDKGDKNDEASKGDDVATEAPKKDESKGGDGDEKDSNEKDAKEGLIR